MISIICAAQEEHVEGGGGVLGDLLAAGQARRGSQLRMANMNPKNGWRDGPLITWRWRSKIGPGLQLRSPVARAGILITGQLASKVC
jgi:hypothetical protein